MLSFDELISLGFVAIDTEDEDGNPGILGVTPLGEKFYRETSPDPEERWKDRFVMESLRWLEKQGSHMLIPTRNRGYMKECKSWDGVVYGYIRYNSQGEIDYFSFL